MFATDVAFYFYWSLLTSFKVKTLAVPNEEYSELRLCVPVSVSNFVYYVLYDGD